MYKQLLAIPMLAATILGGGLVNSAFAGGSSGNTINNTSVTNTLNTPRGTGVTVNRESRSTIVNPTGPNVHNDIQMSVTNSCGTAAINNNVSHRGSTGAAVSVSTDVCVNMGGAAGRRR
jgi:hypothetical protein